MKWKPPEFSGPLSKTNVCDHKINTEESLDMLGIDFSKAKLKTEGKVPFSTHCLSMSTVSDQSGAEGLGVVIKSEKSLVRRVEEAVSHPEKYTKGE